MQYLMFKKAFKGSETERPLEELAVMLDDGEIYNVQVDSWKAEDYFT